MIILTLHSKTLLSTCNLNINCFGSTFWHRCRLHNGKSKYLL